MATRSEAQKAADKRYAEKVQKEKRYNQFVVNLRQEEYTHVENVLKEHGMGKTEFLRWAVAELERRGGLK